MKTNNGPKVLVFDIETAPIVGYTWGIYDQSLGLNQIKSDWHVLSWAAKWLGDSKIMYEDQRDAKPIENDKKILKKIWELLDEADVVITQNGKDFDVKKLNARFIIHGFEPPSSFKHIDTLKIAKKYFGFTSNKLEYLAKMLNTQTKKLTKREFDGFELWIQCLKGNIKAWNEMEKYNKHDVLALEEVYRRLMAWDNTINFSIYHDSVNEVCRCGSTSFLKRGFYYTSKGKFQRYRCNKCGAETRSTQNLFSKDKIKSLRVGTDKK